MFESLPRFHLITLPISNEWHVVGSTQVILNLNEDIFVNDTLRNPSKLTNADGEQTAFVHHAIE